MDRPTRDYLLPGLWSIAADYRDHYADLDVSDEKGIVLVTPQGRSTLVAPHETSHYKQLFAPRLKEFYEGKK